MGDGTLIAAVKSVLWREVCGGLPGPGTAAPPPPAIDVPTTVPPLLPGLPPLLPDLPLDLDLGLGLGGSEPAAGDDGLRGLLERVLGGRSEEHTSELQSLMRS